MAHLTTAEKVELLEYAAELLNNDEEQTSGTDVLPSDCSGCPLYQTEHKSDTVSVELTREERGWLQIVILSSYMRARRPAMAKRLHEKLEGS